MDHVRPSSRNAFDSLNRELDVEISMNTWQTFSSLATG